MNRKTGKRITAAVLTLVLLLGMAGTAPPARAAAKKLAAITFDDGPGPYTDRLLDGLKARGVKATFFMLGSRAEAYPEVVKRVYREGHQVANHSYGHPDLTTLSDAGVRSQIQTTNQILDRTCGKGTSYLVRSPYGSENSRTRSLIGAPLIFWSVDPLDWKYRNAETVKQNILRDTFDGAIVLVHDIHSTSVDGALAAIDALKSRGYELVTVRELFRRRGKALQKGADHYSCKPTGKDLGPVKAPVITNEAESGRLKITITAQAGARIYYSIDGSALNGESKRYTGPFYADSPCTVRAVAAFDMNGSRSEEAMAAITRPTAKAPRIQVENGILTLKNVTEGARVFYTLDGTAATTASTEYTGPVELSPGTVISACAGGGELLSSGEARAVYSHRGNFFRDIFPGQWYYSDADRAVSEGYLYGMGDGLFAPEKPVTRGQLVTFLYRYSGEQAAVEELGALPFADVAPEEYYGEAVAWAYGRGIVSGYSETVFRPERKVTREEMSVIFAKFLRYRGTPVPDSKGAAKKYLDSEKISPWAMESVEQMTAWGLLAGDTNGKFLPGAGSTRGQAASVLMRLADLVVSS